MSITATSVSDSGYLRVECAGEFSLESATEVYERAYALAAAAGREAVLVDIRKTTGREPTVAERYALAVHVAEFELSRKPRIRFALLGHEPMIHPERFGEIVAANRGANARAFTDEAQALKWLRGRARES